MAQVLTSTTKEILASIGNACLAHLV